MRDESLISSLDDKTELLGLKGKLTESLGDLVIAASSVFESMEVISLILFSTVVITFGKAFKAL